MKQIGYLIETEPLYKELYQEMFPVEKIEKEVQMILRASHIAELEKESWKGESNLTGITFAPKPYKRKKV